MNSKIKLALATAVLVAMVGVGAALALDAGPQITWDVVAGGGGVSQGMMAGPTPVAVVVMDTFGQPVVDISTGGNVQIHAGFWYLLGVKYGIYLPVISR